MKKTENVNLLILGSRTDPGFITMLNKMLWSATGASKPMDQKSYIPISPNGKCKIDSSRTIAMIQRRP